MAPARIIDLTLAGAQYNVMKGALDVLTTAPEFDLVVVVVGSSARFYPDLAVKPIIDSAGAKTPIAAFLVPEAPDALARLAAAGVPSFHTPEACADAVAAALKRRPPRPIERVEQAAGDGRILDELEAYALLEPARRAACAVGRARRRHQAGARHCRSPIRSRSRRCQPRSRTSPTSAASMLNVRDDAGRLAGGDRKTSCGRPRCDRVLVQPMMPGLGEVLIGYRRDADVGPMVMLAAGGMLAEIHRDRSLRLAPIDLAEANAMIGEVASLKALAGYRGRPAGDLDALAQGAGGAVAACGARRPGGRRGRDQSADRAQEGRRRRRSRCAGEDGQ